MMNERGIGLAHTTILRYTPEFEKAMAPLCPADGRFLAVRFNFSAGGHLAGQVLSKVLEEAAARDVEAARALEGETLWEFFSSGSVLGQREPAPDSSSRAGSIRGALHLGGRRRAGRTVHAGARHRESNVVTITVLRVTLFIVETQNITLSLPRELLRRIKRIAADRDTSVSSMMIETLSRLADEDRRYSAARKRCLAALQSARSLGTGGRRTWSRDEVHER